jgi:acyl transferase domain-containing protein
MTAVARPPGPSGDGDRAIAIVGAACTFPGARNLGEFWENVIAKVDAVGDPPADWDPEGCFDPETGEAEAYGARGGYLGDLAAFEPLAFGIMPRAVDGGEPGQYLALATAHDALADAGYLDRPFDRQRTEVILGHGTFLNRGSVTALQHSQLIAQTLRILRELHPEHSADELRELKAALKANLPPFSTDTAPALVPNMVAGRIANRLDLMGPNFTVDAACASSLIAVHQAVRDLQSGRCDMAITGGIHAATPPIVVLGFCMLGAISRRQQIRPFDEAADGTLLGEGVGMMVLRRRADAVRDGDRIYAVIRGIGTSSDGRAVGLLAPRLEGEELALRRAYDDAGVPPASIGLVETHGTGTPVGDAIEIQALARVFGAPPDGPWCAVGSVKSMISHTMEAAGAAGLIKTALALHHKVLPPTLNCEDPIPELKDGTTPFYANTETRPWIHGGETPRRAAVSAFGFGGINAHVVLEEQADGA